MVAAEVSAFAFDAALLVAAGRITELALITPVRTESNEAAGLFAPIAAQYLLHRTCKVIVAEKSENPAKIAECQLMSFKKCLLSSVCVGPVKCSAAGHRTHLEDLQLGTHAINIGVRFVPVHLRFHAPVVTLWNENFVSAEPRLPPLLVNIAAHRALASREAGQLLA